MVTHAELRLLRAFGQAHRGDLGRLAAYARLPLRRAVSATARLIEEGLVEVLHGRVVVSGVGEERLRQAAVRDAEGMDLALLREVLRRFRLLDAVFEDVVRDSPAVLDQLVVLHAQAEPVLRSAVELAPSLGDQQERLRLALELLHRHGDRRCPVVGSESYEAVWSELRDELQRLERHLVTAKPSSALMRREPARRGALAARP